MKPDGLGVVEYCLRQGYCSTLDPTSAAWYELHVKCTRLFYESYEQLQPAFDLLLVICEQMHSNGKIKVK